VLGLRDRVQLQIAKSLDQASFQEDFAQERDVSSAWEEALYAHLDASNVSYYNELELVEMGSKITPDAVFADDVYINNVPVRWIGTYIRMYRIHRSYLSVILSYLSFLTPLLSPYRLQVLLRLYAIRPLPRKTAKAGGAIQRAIGGERGHLIQTRLQPRSAQILQRAGAGAGAGAAGQLQSRNGLGLITHNL
jgi:hypothetical protein